MEKINVIHHMNELRNILSYATNIGFFFGAGTSCAFGLPNIMTLTDECKKRLSISEQTLFGNIESSVKDLEGKNDVLRGNGFLMFQQTLIWDIVYIGMKQKKSLH